MFPVRCFTCGAVIAHKWEEYKKLVSEGKSPRAALDELGVERYCCRRMFFTYKSVIQELARYRGVISFQDEWP